jgi:catechol 2,3-dioxygenase-like lactoylglutathione lyase family enzyme
MPSHVFVGVNDFERAFGFYTALMSDYHGAYFRDPDGNKLCVCCHTPPSTC